MSLDIDITKDLPSFHLHVAFTVGDETFGLLGASGCGKSLTLRSIAGIETPDSGHIIVNGQVFFDSESGVNLTPQQRKTALLFQNYMLFPNLTVEQNVASGIDRSIATTERAHIVQEELKRFDVVSLAQRYPAQLSGGQQQRVALARMLAAKPGILMLDEPFSALDAHLKGMLEQDLLNLFDTFSGTIIYVSHDIDEALHFCDRIAVMDDGGILEIDEGQTLVHHPRSLAGIKLSGCKNVAEASYVDDHHVYCPQWGVKLATEDTVPKDVRAIGVRAFYLRSVDVPGTNVFRMHVDRVSDARFERTILLSFMDVQPHKEDVLHNDTSHYLQHRLYWRIGHLKEHMSDLPEKGDEILIEIPARRLYLVTR
jgi:molybdate transport system ATP-binding protein